MKKMLYLASVAAALTMVSAPASAAVFTGSATGGAINDYATLSTTISVPNAFVLTDVNVVLTSLVHTFWSDLIITLTHGGITSTLISGKGSGSNPNGIFTFDDSATSSTFAINTSGGTFRPETSLSAFNNTSSAGNWTLNILDAAGQDTGNLGSWTLQLTGNAVPEPATWAMMIAGFGLVGASMRRRRTNVTVSYA